jgi:hypothetical protein
MPDTDLKIIKQELYNGYSKHNESKEIIISLIKNGVSTFGFKYSRIEKKALISYCTFDFRFYYYEDNVAKELFYINCKHSRKTLISFLEILQYITKNYDVKLVNEFFDDGYFYDEVKEEIVRHIYK